MCHFTTKGRHSIAPMGLTNWEFRVQNSVKKSAKMAPLKPFFEMWHVFSCPSPPPTKHFHFRPRRISGLMYTGQGHTIMCVDSLAVNVVDLGVQPICRGFESGWKHLFLLVRAVFL